MAFASAASAELFDEFRVKRQEVHEFTEKPKVTRDGDQMTIRFAVKAYCDATVAIEDGGGKIVRHLASGVLGSNAPPPFQKDSPSQRIVWDGKDDSCKHIDDKDRLAVRVSLGLKPQLERTMFWSPHKRIGFSYPVMRAAPEGVYVAEGRAVDHVRLFDHDGNYLRTVYPFPADKAHQVAGLNMHRFAQDARELPLKGGYHQATLLTSGTNNAPGSEVEGCAVHAMDVRGERMALVYLRLNRLSTSGATPPGLSLTGPPTSQPITRNSGGWGHDKDVSSPLSVAFSPDGKWLYLAGYQFTARDSRQRSWLNGVARMAYESDDPPSLFVGNLTPGEKNGGTAAGQFQAAASVDCDLVGRVYVADFMNDRVQVFDPAGKHLKSIPVAKPAKVAIHRRTGEIFVFSWLLQNRLIKVDETGIRPMYHHLGTFDDPKVKVSCPLPLSNHSSKTAWNSLGGVQHRVELDSWTDKPRVWIVNGSSGQIHYNDDGSFRGMSADYDSTAVTIYEETAGQLQPVGTFIDQVRKSVRRAVPPILWRQRLYANPTTGECWVAEGDCGVMKAFNQVVVLDPASGRTRLLDLPMGSEDLCFDQSGRVYLRTDTVVARYDPVTWREIPWNYGEELSGHSYGMGAKGAIGVPWLQLIDHDVVEAVNLAPQGYLEADLGRPKVEATAGMCRRLNSQVEVCTEQARFRRSIEVGNSVFCCVDSITTRRLIWEAVKDKVDFWVDGRMSAETLRVLTAADPGSRRHYPTTLFAQAEAFVGACTTRSTIFCSNIAAGLMVSQLAKWLRGLPVEPDLTLNLLASEMTVAAE